MDESTRGPSRRSFLTRGIVLAAGALGFGAGTASASTSPTTKQLVLHGRLLRLHAPNRRAGVPPAAGEHLTASAELHDPLGRKLGEFSSAFFSLAPAVGAAGGASSLELHSFT